MRCVPFPTAVGTSTMPDGDGWRQLIRRKQFAEFLAQKALP
jgi:hypothetical protein